MRSASPILRISCRAIAAIGTLAWHLHTTATAYAGMPSARLSDAASLRFQTISFFLLVLVLSAVVVRWIWNTVVTENTKLPVLTFRRSLGIVVLWGLLFVIVLTMISGARELMTPGAWERKGLTYELRDRSASDQPNVDEAQLRERETALRELGAYLIASARANDGSFPGIATDALAPPSAWLVPGTSDLRYVYSGQEKNLSDSGAVIVCEPSVFNDAPLEFLADGSIRRNLDK